MDFDADDTIVNPRQYEDKPEWGIVVGVGIGRMSDHGQLILPQIEVGDVVVFGQYSSTVVRSHGVDFFYVRSEDILSRYESKE